MDRDGMLGGKGQLKCTACGVGLDVDGHHPAERYAGTYTGLCYACERAPACEVRDLVSGAKVWSHPPHCPSWRRDRETFYGFEGCATCAGKGRVMVSRAFGFGGPYPVQCEACRKRHEADPAVQEFHHRQEAYRAAERVWRRRAIEEYEERLHRTAGEKRKRLSEKRIQELKAQVDPEGEIARAVVEEFELVKPTPETFGVEDGKGVVY